MNTKKKVHTFVKVFSGHAVSKILVSEEENFSLYWKLSSQRITLHQNVILTHFGETLSLHKGYEYGIWFKKGEAMASLKEPMDLANHSYFHFPFSQKSFCIKVAFKPQEVCRMCEELFWPSAVWDSLLWSAFQVLNLPQWGTSCICRKDCVSWCVKHTV